MTGARPYFLWKVWLSWILVIVGLLLLLFADSIGYSLGRRVPVYFDGSDGRGPNYVDKTIIAQYTVKTSLFGVVIIVMGLVQRIALAIKTSKSG